MPEVDYVVITAGSFDILVEVVCEDDDHLLDVINTRIRAIPGVDHRDLRLPEARASRSTPGEPDDHHRTNVASPTTTTARPNARARPPVDALHPALDLRGRRPRAGHRPRRGRLHLGHAGRRYLDGLAGLFAVQVGHGRTELAEAAAKQASELAFFPLWSYAHPKAIELAERLAAVRPRRPEPGLLHHRRRRGGRDAPGSWPSSTSSSPASP